MRVAHENMSVAEFTSKHEGYETPVDANGIQLPLESSIRVEYWGDEEPWAYAVIDENSEPGILWNQGDFRRFDGMPYTALDPQGGE